MRLVYALLFLTSSVLLTTQVQAQNENTLSLRDRVFAAARIYNAVTTYFAHWEAVSREQFDTAYGVYLDQILTSGDRRDFDLASVELLASLRNGHTWFSDRWLESQYGQSVGFSAAPVEDRWVVTASHTKSPLKKGDVIVSVNGIPTQKLFEQNEKFLSASNRHGAQLSLFDTPFLFAARFEVEMGDGRHFIIDRSSKKEADEESKTEGRWLTPGEIAYIKIPSFFGVGFEASALNYVHEFFSAKALIVDVRGNQGGDAPPTQIQNALMDRPYKMWDEKSSFRSGLLAEKGYLSPTIDSRDITRRPGKNPFKGKLIILVDGSCASYCEDFVMPFKASKRAQLIGETTAGTYSATYYYEFDNGMRMNIAATNEEFPSGLRFEGLGISPDIEILPTIEELKAGTDRVMNRALVQAAHNF